MNKETAFKLLLEDTPFLMQQNIADDADYIPEERPDLWALDLVHEVNYELGEPDSPYLLGILGKAARACNKVIDEYKG